MLKQWKQAQMDGSHGDARDVPIACAGTAHCSRWHAIAFFLLVDSGNLNFVSAVSIGYVLKLGRGSESGGTRSTALASRISR